jgi:hypothetical protein
MEGMLGQLTGLIAVLCIFGVPGILILGKSAIGKAIVHRITYGAESGEMLAELDEVRGRLAEVEERLDFAERQLTAGPAPVASKQRSEA